MFAKKGEPALKSRKKAVNPFIFFIKKFPKTQNKAWQESSE